MCADVCVGVRLAQMNFNNKIVIYQLDAIEMSSSKINDDKIIIVDLLLFCAKCTRYGKHICIVMHLNGLA